MIGLIKTALAPYLLWVYLAVGVAVLGALYAAYDWAYDRGYAASVAEQKAAEDAQRKRNAVFDQERASNGAALAKRFDSINDKIRMKAQHAKAQPLPATPSAQCVRDENAAGMSGVSDAVGGIDACAPLADLAGRYRQRAIDNAATAALNEAQVTGLQAATESNRAAYNKLTGNKDDRPVSDAIQRFENLTKRFEAKAEKGGK